MKKSKFTPHYASFRARLTAMRKNAGLTQRKLAAKLDVVRTIIERIEMGQRRVDVVELYWLCKACGVDPKKEFGAVADALRKADRGK